MLQGRSKPPFAPLKRNLLTIPGKAGAYLRSTDTDVLVINQPIAFRVEGDEQALRYKEELANWLLTDEAVPLFFDDELGRVYYAVVNNTIDDFERISILRKGTITFVCLDPYAYSTQQKTQMLNSDINIVLNEGTADTYPNFEATVINPITHLDIVAENGYMRIGQPIEADQTPFVKEQLILRDTMATLTGWTSASDVDGGVVAGEMYSDGAATFRAQSYGTGSQWHGPAVKKSLSEQLQDFQIDVYMTLKTTEVTEAGRVEIYLLDVNNNRIGKLSLKDMLVGADNTMGEIRIGPLQGGHYLIQTHGVRPGLWNNFYGILRLRREGNQLQAYIAMIDTQNGSQHHTRWNEIYVDVEEKYLTRLAQIQVHIGQYADRHWVRDIGVHEIRVWKINQQQGIPYIAQPGDQIIVDHKTNNILINGESRIDLKDFGASYFPLKKGYNFIGYSPADDVDMTIKWRERFK